MANDQDMAGLPEDVREAIRRADAGFDHTGLFDEPAWRTIRAELLRLARENADLRSRCNVFAQSTARFRGDKERAEAELAALKRKIAEAPKAIVSRMGGTVGGSYPAMQVSQPPSIVFGGDLIGKRVALLPVGGESPCLCSST